MDPSYNLCFMYDTLKEKSPPFVPLNWHESDNDTFMINNMKSMNKDIENVLIGYSLRIFGNKGTMKLANIDAITHITGNLFTFENKTSNNIFKYYTSINDFKSYLKYRFPLGKEYVKDNILKENPEGIDLIIGADGNLVEQCLLGLSCTKYEGNFLLKFMEINQQIIYILSQAFNRTLIFNPISAPSEKYLVCISRKWNVQDYYQSLRKPENIQVPDNFIQQTNIREIYSKEYYYLNKLLTIWNLPDYHI